MTRIKLAIVGIVAASGLLVPDMARAAALIFDDSVEGEITVLANDFEFGSTLNGNPFQSGLSNPATETIPGEGPVTFVGSWIDLGASGANSRTIYIVDSLNPLLVSDVFSYSWSTDGFAGIITATLTSSDELSDLGPLPGGVDPGDVFQEPDSVPFSLAFLGGEIRFVPEPGSCLLVMAGAAGLAARRKTRRAA